MFFIYIFIYKIKNFLATYKKMKLDHQLTPYTKINSRWIKDLNMSQHQKVLEENIGKEISDIPCSNIFTNMSPKARDLKNKQMRFHQIKKLLEG